MLDLDTTIAYDEAEQDEEMPSSTPLDTSSSPLFTESSEVLDTQDSESTPSTLLSCESTDADNIGEGISQEPGPQPSAPFVSSFADTKIKEAMDLFLGEEELGLDKLFQRNDPCPC